jgi:NADPH-ferrihemoprotein reductase
LAKVLTSSIRYEPGDHIGVFAENDPELVKDVAVRLGVDLNASFSLYNAEAKGPSKPVIGPCTVQLALSQWCELNTPPRKALLKVLAQYAKDETEKANLLELADEDKHVPFSPSPFVLSNLLLFVISKERANSMIFF